MTIYNSAKRARYANTIVNRPQGGGSKKAGFPNMIGRDTNTTIAYGNTKVLMGKCCTLKSYMTMPLFQSSQARNIGRTINADYYKVPGQNGRVGP